MAKKMSRAMAERMDAKLDKKLGDKRETGKRSSTSKRKMY